MKKYQELENKVKENQAEIDRLKKEIDRLKKEEENELPKQFTPGHALGFLNTFSSHNLDNAFAWIYTPQGFLYWSDIYQNLEDNSDYVVPDKAIIQIQKWVILSFLNA
jgi:uncharacterized protein Yka (UPF0111/DUF47 family)